MSHDACTYAQAIQGRVKSQFEAWLPPVQREEQNKRDEHLRKAFFLLP